MAQSRHLLRTCKPCALLQSAVRLHTAGRSESDAQECIAPPGIAMFIEQWQFLKRDEPTHR